MTVIGIDLGTTHSCVAVFDSKRRVVEVLENDHGRRTTPSYVAFTENEVFVGNEAKNHCLIDSENVVFDAKRLIGRRFEDNCVQEDMERNWPFTVVNENRTPMIQVNYLKEKRCFIPELISAKVLECMKTIAEYKNVTVTGAVVTVPAYFNDCQREATKVAARIAGFKNVRLLNEPTAAAIAFALRNKDITESNILVYDLGGGTFDVSVLTVRNGKIIVKAVNGDTHLGGNDFDDKILEYFLEEIKRVHKKDLRHKDYRRQLARLRQACELVKISLNKKGEAQCGIDCLLNGKNFTAVILRAKFEEICDELMRKTLDPMKQALIDAKLTIDDINEVLLVGGSARIPKIQQLVAEFFENKLKLNTTINPEEAVASGAAIFGAILENDCNEAIGGISLSDVVPLSYGVEDHDGIMEVIIPRNTTYPVKKSMEFCTAEDNLTHVRINVYQGEREVASANHYLSGFTVRNIPKKLAGDIEVEATMEIDEDGILVVTVVETTTGVNGSTTITNVIDRFSEKEIERQITEAETMRENDKKYKEKVNAKNKLEFFINKIKHCLNETSIRYNKDYEKKLKNIIQDYQNWTTKNPNASKDDIDAKYEMIKTDFELSGCMSSSETTNSSFCSTS